MKELVEEIVALTDDMKTNMVAFVEKGNKAAGRRARKASNQLAKLLKDFRKESIASEKVED